MWEQLEARIEVQHLLWYRRHIGVHIVFHRLLVLGWSFHYTTLFLFSADNYWFWNMLGNCILRSFLFLMWMYGSTSIPSFRLAWHLLKFWAFISKYYWTELAILLWKQGLMMAHQYQPSVIHQLLFVHWKRVVLKWRCFQLFPHSLAVGNKRKFSGLSYL